MKDFVVLYHDPRVLLPCDPPLAFVCQAENPNHAEEQCEDDYHPNCHVVWIVEGCDVNVALQDYWGNN